MRYPCELGMYQWKGCSCEAELLYRTWGLSACLSNTAHDGIRHDAAVDQKNCSCKCNELLF